MTPFSYFYYKTEIIPKIKKPDRSGKATNHMNSIELTPAGEKKNLVMPAAFVRLYIHVLKRPLSNPLRIMCESCSIGRTTKCA